MAQVAIIATVLDGPHITGVERYAIELIKHLQPHYDEVLVLCHPAGTKIFSGMAKLHIKRSPFTSRILTDQVWVPWIIRRLRPDFIFNASLSYPWLGFDRTPFACVMHDATPWRFPETTSQGMRLYYKPLMRRELRSKHLKGIVTNSRSSKYDLVRYCAIDERMIWDIHLGVDHNVFRAVGPRVARSPFLLTVGTLEPRKNLQTAIRAFELVASEWPDLSLVIVGRRGWLRSLEVPRDLAHRVQFTGYVTDEELAQLYRSTELFLMPSLYEGFGFPVLEAMCCGAPVLASRNSSLPEIGGDACLYADPLSPEDFAKKMRLVLSDANLRRQLSERALARCQEFSWSLTAERTWSLIMSLANQVTGAREQC
ncbi:MAG: glycosyltransferase family 4 protein [Alicyclobacillus macrosporangiidus]|uniref:glycosyltransferase family 4 protein n=1 Tax=Alicyclobacillus macrosporangiidus TaxID=392015 RepID=UPI0034E974F8|nr:glycosyltransferase family 4 protein [Alicyclobacillus macrosporangiidus]